MKRSTPTDSPGKDRGTEGPEAAVSAGRTTGFWTIYLSGWLAYAGLIVVVGRVEEANLLQSFIILLPIFLLSLPLAEWRRRSPREESGLFKATLIHLGIGLTYGVIAAGVINFLLVTLLPLSPGGIPRKPRPDFGNLMVMAGFLYVLQAIFFEWTALAQKMRVARDRAAEESVLRAKAEAKAVRARFNPHFVFNTLHSLLLLVRSDPGAAEKTIEDVADLIRYATVLDRREQDVVGLSQELEVAKKYLELEALRLADRLTVEWEIPSELEGYKVPALSLQILLENAIRHGLSPKAEGGTVRISAELAGGKLLVQVQDDGMGASSEEVEEAKDRGLSLLRQHIALLHGDGGGVSLTTSPGDGFSVTMMVPAERTPQAKELGDTHG